MTQVVYRGLESSTQAKVFAESKVVTVNNNIQSWTLAETNAY